MNYEEAKYYFENTIDGVKSTILFSVIADDDIKEGISYIKELTSCDDQTAKLIWCDLKMDYGTKENNPILQAREQYQAEESRKVNQPHCPTCNSTNIKKISTTAKVTGAIGFGLLSKTARSQFKCENCGYKW